MMKGFIENRTKLSEELETQATKSLKKNLKLGFVYWGVTIPSVLAYVLCFYIITPTSVNMAIAFYIGLDIRNCISFFSKTQTSQT